MPGYYHIGYHRTGSTFLQTILFPNYEDHLIVAGRAARFFIDDQEYANGQEHYLSLLPEENRGQKVIVSSEGLSGDLFRDRLDVPQKIHSISPNAKIIVCIRSQVTILPSLYHLYVKSGGGGLFRDYANKVIDNRKLDYYQLIRAYRQLFGEDSILVLLYEDLKHRPEKYLHELCQFLGLSEKWPPGLSNRIKNKRPPNLVIRGTRVVNVALQNSTTKAVFRGLTPSSARKIRHLSRRGFFWTNVLLSKLNVHISGFDKDEGIKLKVETTYGESNRRLFEWLRLDEEPRMYNYPGHTRSIT